MKKKKRIMAQIKEINNIIKMINQFSDSKLLENTDETLTNIEAIQETNENKKNDEKKKIKSPTQIQDQSTKSKTKTSIIKKPRTDNTRIEAFITPMLFLKEFFILNFDLDFSDFKCTEAFGPSIGYMIQVIDLYVYQLFCAYPKNKGYIIDVYNKEMPKNKKILFCYFMTLTYREIYERFVSGNIKFPLFKRGYLTITLFPTLKKAKQKKQEKYLAKGLSVDYINKKISCYETACREMIKNIDNKKLERGEEKNILFKVEEIGVLDREKAQFEKIAKFNSIKLKED